MRLNMYLNVDQEARNVFLNLATFGLALIDEKTKECLLQAQKLPGILELYTLTKIHKPKLVGQPINSGYASPVERISAFIDQLLQLLAKSHNSNSAYSGPFRTI